MLIGARTHDFGLATEITFEERLQLIKQIGYETIQLAPAEYRLCKIFECPDCWN